MILWKEVVVLPFAGPDGLRGFEAVERNSRWEGDLIGATRMEMARINADELALPEQTQRHLPGIEGEVDPFRVSDADSAVAHRALSPAQLCHVADPEFPGLSRQPDWLLRPLAIGQIDPQGLDLLGGVAVQEVGSARSAIRPVAGHDDRRVEACRFP